MATRQRTCVVCGNAFTPSRFHSYQKFCSKKCRWKYRDRMKRGKTYYRKLRLEALKILGGKCAICGIDDVRLLTVDHMEANNLFIRKNKRILYEVIIKYPEKAKTCLQVLCWNHNAMKYFYSNEFDEENRRVAMAVNPRGS